MGCDAVWIFECGDFTLTKEILLYNVENLKFNSIIKPGYRLQLIGRDSPNSKWEFICGTPSIPTSVDLCQLVRSEWIPVNIDADAKYIDILPANHFCTRNKALKDAPARWRLVYGTGNITLNDDSNMWLGDNRGFAELAGYAGERYTDYHAYINYEFQNDNSFSNDLPDNFFVENGVVYKINCDDYSNTSATVVGYSADRCPQHIVINDVIKVNNLEYRVTDIENGAFAWNHLIKNVDMSNSAHINVHGGAFSYMNNLESITIDSEKDPNVGSYMFHRSNNLKRIYEKGSFYSCNSDGSPSYQISEFAA